MSSSDPVVPRWQRAAFVASVILMAFPTIRIGTGAVGILPEHLAILLLLLVVLRRRRYERAASPKAARAGLVLIVLWWLFTLLASLFIAPEPLQSLRLMIWVAANIIIAALVYSLRKIIPTCISTMTWALVTIMVWNLGGWAVAQSSGSLNDFVESDYATSVFRIKGLFLEPNLYAAFITLALAALYTWARSVSALAYWMFAAVGTVSIYLTFTRVAWVALALILTASIVRVFRRRPAELSVMLLVVLSMLTLALINTDTASSPRSGDPVFDATIGRIVALFDTDHGTGFTRVLTIESALNDLTTSEAWWTGFGFNGYSQVHDSGVTSYARPYLPTLWIAIFYDGGIIAGFCFTLAAVVFWLSSRRQGSTLFFLSFALLAGATNNIWFAFPWVFGGMIMAASAIACHSRAPADQGLNPARRIPERGAAARIGSRF